VSTQENIQVVQDMYAAFGAGNIHLQNGKVKKFRSFYDTAAAAGAYR